MTEQTQTASVAVLSEHDCEALYQGALSVQATSASDEPAPLPVSAATWAAYYQQQLPSVHEPWFIDRRLSTVAGQPQALALALIEPQLPCFAGHFPGHPILPGVVQINWMVTLAAEMFGAAYGGVQFAGLARVKFKAPIEPGAILRFQLRPGPGKIALTIASRTGVHTEGRLLYRA